MDLDYPVRRYDHTNFFGGLHTKVVLSTTRAWAPPPTTNILNESNYPIDGICYSLGLISLRPEYSKLKEGIPSDHRMSWVEFPLIVLFEANDNITKKVTKLKVSDQRDVKRYISRSKKYLKQNNCLQKMKELYSIPIEKFMTTKQKEYDRLL